MRYIHCFSTCQLDARMWIYFTLQSRFSLFLEEEGKLQKGEKKKEEIFTNNVPSFHVY